MCIELNACRGIAPGVPRQGIHDHDGRSKTSRRSSGIQEIEYTPRELAFCLIVLLTQLQLAGISPPTVPKSCGCDAWTYVESWHSAKTATITNITNPDHNIYFGM